MPPLSPFKGYWIWKPQASYNPYQQTIYARRILRCGPLDSALLRIAVDGQYRLVVNGEWVGDGPARSWPEHFQYDTLDLTPYLFDGENELLVIARHWSVGTFHSVPRQAGLLVQLDLELTGGRKRVIAGDRSWQVAEANAWRPNTPRVSIQMEPQELYDARLEDDLEFEPAAQLYPAAAGPWQDLQPRDVAMLTRSPLSPRAFLGANLLAPQRDIAWCVPTGRLANPGLIEANRSTANQGGMAVLLELAQPAALTITADGFIFAVDAATAAGGRFDLQAGQHLLLAFSSGLFGHNKDRSLRLVDPPAGLGLTNPLDPAHPNPWCRIDLPAFAYHSDDLVWPSNLGLDGERERLEARYDLEIRRLLAEVKDAPALGQIPSARVRCLPAEELFVEDSHAQFTRRQVQGSARELVANPTALMHDQTDMTLVEPSPEGDIELVYDFGQQTVGYYELELVSEEGVRIDLYSVEYIDAQGRVQHTDGNTNGMRYITRAGANRFTSLKRRAGRYLFITIRNLQAPLRIRKINWIESTYPVDQQGGFDCSDSRLTRIWEISARTLKLCMEDTFTDCPLYEQTLWVGDARNEALYAYDTFAAADLARRCLRLTAQSLERYPIAGCQVPSSWDVLLPAWSFLWGIAVWDYYFYSGDRDFAAEMWPAVLRNLEGAAGLLDERGLFSGPFWNMFDWTGIDDRHDTVLHNSLLLVGAIDAALRLADLLADAPHAAWLADFRARLSASLNRQWDPARRAFPDSIHADGRPSPSTSLHTSFLALLYDVLPPAAANAALGNLLDPPAGSVPVGSPFAFQYLFEALEKAGQAPLILEAIYDNYLPMLADGATTVWEVFPSSPDHPQGFPSRSHCHAWSSAPLHFLPRLLLGARPLEPGRTRVEISPFLAGLSWAKGQIATPHGPVHVEWRLDGQTLHLQARGPREVSLVFAGNPSLQGLTIDKNF